MAVVPTGTDRKRAAGGLDGNFNLSPAVSLGGKRQRMVKILGGPVGGDPREALCALRCLSESALFTITCQEVNADGSVPGLDSLPGKHRSLPAGFHQAFSFQASNHRCRRPVTSQGAQLFCTKIFLLNLVLIVVVVKLKIQLWSSIDGKQAKGGFLKNKEVNNKISHEPLN